MEQNLFWNTIRIVYYVNRDKGKRSRPSEAQLKAMNKILYKNYNNILKDVLPTYGIPPTPENKANILMMVTMGKRGGNRKKKVSKACQYFVEVEMHSIDPPVPPPVIADAGWGQ